MATGVRTFPFSVDTGKVIPDATPIASETGGVWKSGSTFVSTTTDVAITAANTITGFGVLQGSWGVLSGAGTVTGNVLNVPANKDCLAIALYDLPDPDPCKGYREAYNNYNPDPGTDPKIIHAERLKLWAPLNACEVKYGERITKKPGL